ncbi:MAG TPA: cell division protein ZapA [Devosia sp.]|nr:cell division protein ZapA [Devosia sp.]
MPEVNVEINGRKYRMACEEGQEQHLVDLAARFNRHIDQFKDGFGEIGDNRLTVMAGIAVIDELVEAERQIATLKQDIETLTRAGQELSEESEELERRFTKRIGEVARKVEGIANAIDDTGAQGN